MSIRTIEYTVTAGGISPSVKQFGGVQGDHNATKLKFILNEEFRKLLQDKEDGNAEIRYRFDGHTSTGNINSTESKAFNLNDNNAILEYPLENKLTRDGGTANVYLVITAIKDGGTEFELFSFPAIIQFKNVPSGKEVDESNHESLTTLAEVAKDAADRAEGFKDEASKSAEAAQKAVASVEIYCNTAQDAAFATGRMLSDAEKAVQLADGYAKSSNNNALKAEATLEEVLEVQTEVNQKTETVAENATTATVAAKNAVAAKNDAESAAARAEQAANAADGTLGGKMDKFGEVYTSDSTEDVVVLNAKKNFRLVTPSGHILMRDNEASLFINGSATNPAGTDVTIMNNGTVAVNGVKLVDKDYVDDSIVNINEGAGAVEIVNSLSSNNIDKALSANMGKVLNETKLDKEIALYEFISPNLLNLETLNTGYKLTDTGELATATNYITSDYIPIESGNTVRYQFNYGSNRYDNTEKPAYTSFTICAYDENKVFIDNSYVTGAKSYVCPDGSKFVRVQFGKGSFNTGNFSDCAIVISGSAEVIPFYPYGLTERHIKTDILPAGQDGNKVIQNSNNESSIEINVPQLKKNKTIGFIGLFNTFEPLYIYQGKGTGFTESYCKIDETNLQVYQKGNETPILDVAHNLTISNYISVVISTENNNKTTIYICSNGQSFTSSSTTWFSSRDKIIAEHGTTSWQNILTFGSKDFGERVWLYGDSYFDHWVPILLDRGYTAFLCDGYSGGTSLNGAKSFELALTMGTPAKVVWCLGMNDADEGKINSNWQTAINRVKNLCDVYGIKLVVCTIPWVPSREHKHKNAYIRDVAKFNYIDISRFVGSQFRDGTSTGMDWFDGLLSTDNVHPSAQGDIYIANIMQTYLPDLRNS